jgi:hypothetical protein
MSVYEHDQEFRVFLRKARQAAHQALYFLYELEAVESLEGRMRRADSALEKDVAFAREQVRLIVEGVREPVGAAAGRPMPAAATVPTSMSRFFFDGEGVPKALSHLHDNLWSAKEVDRKDAQNALAHFWTEHIQAGVQSPGPLSWRADSLTTQLRAFLHVARPRGFDLVHHGIDKGWTMVRRNLSFLVGLVVAIAAFALVPQLRSLLMNNPRGYAALAVVAGGGLFIEILRYAPLTAVNLLALVMPSRIKTPLKELVEGKRGYLRMLTVRLRMGKRAYYQWASHAIPPDRGIARWPEAGRMRGLMARWEVIRAVALIGFLLVAYKLGFSIVEAASAVTYKTVYPVASLFAVGLMALHWVDLWDFLDRRPIRMLGLGLLILFLVGSLGFELYLLFATTIPLFLFALWLYHAVSRKRVTLAGGLVAVVCVATSISAVSGYFTRERGVWRASPADPTPFARIDETQFPFGGTEGPPVVLLAASGGGSRAAVYTALTLDAIQNDAGLRALGDNIHAISGVSGGSLTTAAYVAERIRRNEHANRGTPEAAKWSLTELARQNFLNPTLEGALWPGESRGDAIEAFWDDKVHLRGRTLRDLSDLWRNAPKAGFTGGTPPFPLPLFNSCSLDGHAVVISPLAVQTYSADNHEKRQARVHELKDAYGLSGVDGLTWVVDRDAVYGLEEWNPHVNPSIAQAVRASANFPFGFPLVDVETTPHQYGAPYQHHVSRMLLTDGGVLSNSGMWTLSQLMTTKPEVKQALKARGVLVVVVDASRMPEYSSSGSSVTTLFGAIRDQAPIAQSLHRKMFELLGHEFGSCIEVVGIDLPPTVRDNVQTTWALDDRSLKQLECNFNALWFGTTFTQDEACVKLRGTAPLRDRGDALQARFREKLFTGWSRLAKRGPHCDPTVPPRKEDQFALLRVPLD